VPKASGTQGLIAPTADHGTGGRADFSRERPGFPDNLIFKNDLSCSFNFQSGGSGPLAIRPPIDLLTPMGGRDTWVFARAPDRSSGLR
jgi:hypothetical protein